MDEQQTPQGQPEQPPASTHLFGEATPAGEPPARRPRRARRWVAAVAATAVVAGAGGAGAGYAFGRDGTSSSTTSASGTQRPNGWTFDDGSSSGSSGGSSGDGSTSPYGTDPFGDDGSSGANPYGGGFGGLPNGQGSTTAQTTVKATASQLTGLVRISTTLKYDGAKAAGTGMILTSDGEIVTNHHVVAGSTSIKVTVMSTGKTYTATVVGTDAKDDVAVLQLAGASGLSTVKTDTDGSSVGDKVIAVGDANGLSYLSQASGQVSALNQSITTQAEGSAASERLTGLIEISSDVISGDSGGATYDADGEVIGMTTAASSGGTDVDGYAVPIAKVLSVVDDLESGVAGSKYDYGYPAFLGIGLGQTGTTVAGAYSGTPAASAGIEAGDTITAVGGTKVTTSTQIHDRIAKLSPGDKVSVTWTDSAGASHTKTLTLATGPVA